jgi:intracellular multiplication protein IcmK
MKIRSSCGIFFALIPLVVLAQNVNTQTAPGALPAAAPAPAPAGKAPSKAPVVSNSAFPSRSEAQAKWDKLDPPQESQTAKGPRTDLYPGTGSSSGTPAQNRVTAPTLPNPKIDYAKEATERVSPMDAKEIQKFSTEMYKRSRAMSATPGPDGEYTVRDQRVERISLAPGAKLPVVDVALNLGAVVSFVDRTGAPLIVDAVKSFSDVVSVDSLPTEDAMKTGSDYVTVMANRLTGRANVMVKLLGVQAKVMIIVEVGKSKDVDGSVQMVVPVLADKGRLLPGDRMEADAGLIAPEMQSFLAGLPPDGAVEIKVSKVGSSTTAWLWKSHVFLRTPHTVFTPAWFRRQGSQDGTAVYELPLTPIVKLGVEGREMMAYLEFPYIPTGAGRAAAASLSK